jgi:anthranilate synthase/phosphoribosyltransferase
MGIFVVPQNSSNFNRQKLNEGRGMTATKMPIKSGLYYMKLLIIDNFDSFTYNLYQLAGEVLLDSGQTFVIDVKRNNEITADEIKQNHYDKIIISPGPGNPADLRYFGVCKEVILDIAKTMPVLGVCLGMQGIAHYCGGKVVRAKLPMHGKTSRIIHNKQGLFKGIPQGINVMRYHSLIVQSKGLPKTLEVTATAGKGGQKEIMGLRHKYLGLQGVQFHPESYATEYGKQILKNFLIDDLTDVAMPLTRDKAYNLQCAILKNQINTDQLLKIFADLDKRDLTADELLGFYRASKDFMQTLPGYGGELLDTCGTGGDNKQTFNISTLAALVCASLGVKVAKHGNRAASSKCGSADILESLGVNINLNPNQARACLDKCGITFMYAPIYHPAFKNAKEARQKFGKKTYFNLLGPLLNPADAKFRLVGVSDSGKIPLVLSLLKQSGVKKALVVHGKDGLDEVSPIAATKVFELNKQDEIKQYIIDPKKYGFKNFDFSDIQVENSAQAKKVFLDVLSGQGKPAQMAVVILNSAAALLAANAVETLEHGIKQAYSALHSGKALAKLEEFKRVSNDVAN